MIRKNVILFTSMWLFAMAANAQYKKASFFSSRGISLEVNARFSFISSAHYTQPALAFSAGKERSGSRYFSWHDFEFLLPAAYRYTTSTYSYNSQVEPKTVTVNSKSGIGFQYRFNSGIFLLNK